MNEKVSIIVPIYNGEKYLQECLDSIQRQTYTNIEIILVNDGSSDKTIDICRENQRNDARIVIVDKENGGVTSARKAGVEKASGEFVMFVDCDDWLDDDMINIYITEIERTQADIVVGKFSEEYEAGDSEVKGGILKAGIYDEHNRNYFLNNMFYCGVVKGWGIWPTLWAKAYRKSLIQESLNELDERIFYGEDAACLFPACIRARRVSIIEDTGYRYRIFSVTSVSTKRNKFLLDNMYYLYDYMCNVFQQVEENDNLMKQLSYYMVSLMNHAGELLFKVPYHLQEIEWVKPQVTEWQQKYYQLKTSIENGEEKKEHYSQIEWLLPYYELATRGSRNIALYGAGKVGKAFYAQLKRESKYSLIVWVDQNECDENGVRSRNTLKEYEYDTVLIAIADPRTAQSAREWLSTEGIDDDKIIWQKPLRVEEYYIQE